MKKNKAAAQQEQFWNAKKPGETFTGKFQGWETSDFGNPNYKPAVIMILDSGKLILNANLKNVLRDNRKLIKKGAAFRFRFDKAIHKGRTELKFYTVWCGDKCLNPGPNGSQPITTAQVFA